MNCFNEEQLSRISHLVREIEKLTDVEKLYLYLQLPCGRADPSDGLVGKQSKPNGSNTSNASGNKSQVELFAKKPDQETTQTYTWILSHLEVDPNVSLPKQEVYDEYRAFCQANQFEPLCVADFGKAMKHAFPCIKPRRLGQRGNSRYCYSGLRKKYKIQPPNLPDMIEPTFCIDNDCSQAYNQIIRDCRTNECSLATNKLVSGEGVVNLKIESGATQHQPATQAPSVVDTNNQAHHHPHHQTLDGSSLSGGSGSQPYNNRHTHNGNQNGRQQQTNSHQMQQRPTLHMPNNNNNNNYSDPILISQPSCSTSGDNNLLPNNNNDNHTRNTYNYMGTIEQPGTPDDDDYLHNYQDAVPTNRHVYNQAPPMPSVSVAQSVSDGSITSSNIATTLASANDGTTYMYQHHHAQESGQKPSREDGQHHHQQHRHHHQQQQQQQLNHDQLIGGTDHQLGAKDDTAQTTSNNFILNPSTSSSASINDQSHIHLTHMNASHMDSCASPFQSPASTPYPMMSNYMTGNEILDYYSLQNTCARYGES